MKKVNMNFSEYEMELIKILQSSLSDIHGKKYPLNNTIMLAVYCLNRNLSILPELVEGKKLR